MPGEEDGHEGGRGRLDWKDYVALFIAMLQTVALPVLILVGVILAAIAILGLLH